MVRCLAAFAVFRPRRAARARAGIPGPLRPTARLIGAGRRGRESLQRAVESLLLPSTDVRTIDRHPLASVGSDVNVFRILRLFAHCREPGIRDVLWHDYGHGTRRDGGTCGLDERRALALLANNSNGSTEVMLVWRTVSRKPPPIKKISYVGNRADTWRIIVEK